jgi:hypothetical protein
MMSEPDSPISLCDNGFWLNETWCVYFCLLCGGKLPDSSKPIYVPFLSCEERARLELLARGIGSREEAIARLGTPDYDEDVAYCDEDVDSGALTQEGEVLNPSIPRTRNVEFYGLSKTGNIEFYFSPRRPAHHLIVPKFLPPRHLEEGETV